jgi:plasmid stabilization system protein ParE
VEIIFLRGAEDDLFAAWQSYEEILPGLGDRFEKEVRVGLDRIATFPESAPVYKEEFRRLLVPRFHHGIFCRTQGARLVVTAVLDLRRDPRAIDERLGFIRKL